MSHNETKAQRGKDATIEVPVGEKRRVALSQTKGSSQALGAGCLGCSGCLGVGVSPVEAFPSAAAYSSAS